MCIKAASTSTFEKYRVWDFLLPKSVQGENKPSQTQISSLEWCGASGEEECVLCSLRPAGPSQFRFRSAPVWIVADSATTTTARGGKPASC